MTYLIDIPQACGSNEDIGYLSSCFVVSLVACRIQMVRFQTLSLLEFLHWEIIICEFRSIVMWFPEICVRYVSCVFLKYASVRYVSCVFLKFVSVICYVFLKHA